MRQDLEEKLMQDFPWMKARHIWTGKKLDFPTPCECEDGWFNIIYNCCKEIDDLYKSKNANINDLIIYQGFNPCFSGSSTATAIELIFLQFQSL